MIRYLTRAGLSRHTRLRDGMFTDRAAQFRTRLKWDIPVDASGYEKDQYDVLEPLYVIWERPDGTHGGSLRYMPTTGRTMIAEHFAHLTPGRTIRDPGVWECTRFCLAPGASGQISAALMLGGLEAGLALGLGHAVGVFDARMMRVYGRIGWPPALLGRDGPGRDAICAGLWTYDAGLRGALAQRAGFSADLASSWVRFAFGAGKPVLAA